MSDHKILTAHNRYVDLLEPDPATIHIDDIAHHLAQINRFTGATWVPYSVAQHAVCASKWVWGEYNDPWAALYALHHDDSEAYLGDVSTPLKSALSEYRRIEERMQNACYEAMGLFRQFVASNYGPVNQSDAVMLRSESDLLMPRRIGGDGQTQYLVPPMKPGQARRRYLETDKLLREELGWRPLN